MWEIVRNIVIGAFGLYALSKVGPPAVDKYFLPTIEYVAGTFQAIAPQPAPATTFMHIQTPMAAEPISAVLKTVFIQQVGYETISMAEAATITGINHGQWAFNIFQNSSESSRRENHSGHSSQNSGLPYEFASFFERCSRVIYEASHAIFLQLRQLFDSFYFHMTAFTAPIISWKLLKRRNRKNIENLELQHEQKIVRIHQEISAVTTVKDLEISLLNAQNKSQQDQIAALETLLNEVKETGQLVNEAKKSADEQSETEIARLNASVTDKDNLIATRDESLAKAIERAQTAEKYKKSLEDKARKSRSDFDSALQKKQNDIDEHKYGSEQAAKDRDTARRDLKDARAQASKDGKKITGLEKKIAGFAKKIPELEAQVREKDASIGRKDAKMTNMRTENLKLVKDIKDMTVEREQASKDGRDDKAKHEKLIRELQAQVTEANNLRKAAEAKASQQEALVAEAVEQQGVAEEKATQLNAEVIEANNTRKAAEAKTLEKEALAAEAAELQKVAEERATQAQNRAAEAEASCKTAKEKASQEELRATETVERLKVKNERIATLEDQRQEKPIWSDTVAPSSDFSSQELSMLPQPPPIVWFPACPAPDFCIHPSTYKQSLINPHNQTQGQFRAATRPMSRWEPPAKARTPPEERDLPKDTPTGPRSGRVEGRN